MKNFRYSIRKMPNADSIIIKHLLEHTSGLGDCTCKHALFWLKDNATEKEMLDGIVRQGVIVWYGEPLGYCTVLLTIC